MKMIVSSAKSRWDNPGQGFFIFEALNWPLWTASVSDEEKTSAANRDKYGDKGSPCLIVYGKFRQSYYSFSELFWQVPKKEWANQIVLIKKVRLFCIVLLWYRIVRCVCTATWSIKLAIEPKHWRQEPRKYFNAPRSLILKRFVKKDLKARQWLELLLVKESYHLHIRATP